MWTLAVRPEVEDDLVEATLWYEDKRVGLGDEFISEYLAAVHRVLDNPLLFAISSNGLRPCRLKRFSYIIHFTVEINQILIVAVIGAERDESAFIYRRD
jgi:hypothetical protein